MIEPIRRTIAVRCDPATAFRVFTQEMGTWWPLDVHARALERDDVKAERIVVEGEPGGRIYEVLSDGSEGLWGTIETWEPPGRLVIAWKPNDRPEPPTELEIRFTTADDGGTIVELEHRGWERLGDVAQEMRDSYAGGWPFVFGERFAQAADAAQ
jgi:uncharacterized protein YndB with AHSA1/START domain